MKGEKFKVGDKLVCIDVGNIFNLNTINRLPALKLNGDYTVIGVYQCPKCGINCVNVGLKSRSSGKHICKCGNATNTHGEHLCASARFVKRDLLHEKNLMKEVKKILEKQKV